MDNSCVASLQQTTLTLIPIKEDFTPGEAKVIDLGAKENSDIEIFGEDKILVLTIDNHLSLIQVKLDDDQNISYEVNRMELVGIKGRNENSRRISLSDDGRYLALHRSAEGYASSISIYEIEDGDNFEWRATLDLQDLNLKYFWNFKFVERNSWSVAFMALPDTFGDNQLLIFRYDTMKRIIEEVGSMRKDLCIDRVYKFVDNLDGELVGISQRSELLKVKYN